MMKFLAPMTIGDILDEAFQLTRRHLGTFAGVIAVFRVPMLLLMLLTSYGLSGFLPAPAGDAILTGAFNLLSALFLYPIYMALTARMASESFLERPISIRDGLAPLRQNWRKYLNTIFGTWLRLLGWTLLIAAAGGALGGGIAWGFQLSWELVAIFAAVGAGLSALIAGGIKGLQWVMVTEVMAIEQISGGEARERSRVLMQKRWSRFTLLTICSGIITVVLVMTIAILPQIPLFGVTAVFQPGQETPWIQQAAKHIFELVAGLIVEPFGTLVIVLFYYDARIRKEGYDLEKLAADLGQAPRA